jgi:hypothetical protein
MMTFNSLRLFLLLCRLAWVFWLVMVVIGSLLPGPMLPAAPVGDKVEHFTAYFGLCVLPPLFLNSRWSIYLSPLSMILVGIFLQIEKICSISGQTPSEPAPASWLA